MSTRSISDAQLDALLRDSPFQALFGLRLESIDAEGQALTIRLPFGPTVERASGTAQYHGGVIASLIDIAGDFALIAVLGHGVPTINFRVDYLRPASHSDLLHALRSGGRAGPWGWSTSR